MLMDDYEQYTHAIQCTLHLSLLKSLHTICYIKDGTKHEKIVFRLFAVPPVHKSGERFG